MHYEIKFSTKPMAKEKNKVEENTETVVAAINESTTVDDSIKDTKNTSSELSAEEQTLFDSIIDDKKDDKPSEESNPVEKNQSEEELRYRSLRSDPVKSQFLDILEGDGLTSFLSQITPKGKDYSKLDLTNKDTQKEVYKEYLISDGAEGEELTKELSDFDSLKRIERKSAIDIAIKALSSKKTDMPSNWQDVLSVESENQRKAKENWAQSAKEAKNNINTNLSNLEGKTHNGVTLTKEDISKINALAEYYTIPVVSKDGRYQYNTKEGLDAALAVYTTPKAIAERDETISKLKNIIRSRVRPNADSSGANGNASKPSPDDRARKAEWNKQYYSPDNSPVGNPR